MGESENIHTLRFLERAASAWQNGDARDHHLPGLMAVCRKVDIGRRLFASYRPDWRNPEDERLLDGHEWMQAVYALLCCAENEPRPEYRFKLINTLLKSVDILGEGVVGEHARQQGEIAELEQRVRDLVEGLR